jgi:hypothetical protein
LCSNGKKKRKKEREEEKINAVCLQYKFSNIIIAIISLNASLLPHSFLNNSTIPWHFSSTSLLAAAAAFISFFCLFSVCAYKLYYMLYVENVPFPFGFVLLLLLATTIRFKTLYVGWNEKILFSIQHTI